MNFIFSLAHFCEIHGPTSILCTQLLPPSCLVCTSTLNRTDIPARDPHDTLSARLSAASQSKSSGSRQQGHLSNDGLLTPVSSGTPSPTDTPPISPRTSHALANSIPYGRGGGGGPSLLSSASSSSSDSCVNCNLTLPKNLNERLPVKDGKKVPVLRSREVVMAGGSREWPSTDAGPTTTPPSEASHKRRRSQHLPKTVTTYPPSPNRRRSSSSGYSSTNSSASSSQSMDQDTPTSSSSSSEIDVPINIRSSVIPVHTHNLTYLSTRFPSVPERYAALRRACVRTLSCESLPTQTGPIFVGDSDAGATIAYVFRLADPKSRGGRRTYALLCLSSEEKKIVSSYGYVTSVFESLVARIQELAKIAAKPPPPPDFSSLSNGPMSPTILKHTTSPDGFLRRHPTAGAGKGLAELVGREQLFVEVHACFSTLLGGLARRFGCLEDTDNIVPPDYYGIAATTIFSGGYAAGGIKPAEREQNDQSKERRDVMRKDKMDVDMIA